MRAGHNPALCMALAFAIIAFCSGDDSTVAAIIAAQGFGNRVVETVDTLSKLMAMLAYGETIVARPVQSADGMSARYSDIPH